MRESTLDGGLLLVCSSPVATPGSRLSPEVGPQHWLGGTNRAQVVALVEGEADAPNEHTLGRIARQRAAGRL